jgi:hypothetical protein
MDRRQRTFLVIALALMLWASDRGRQLATNRMVLRNTRGHRRLDSLTSSSSPSGSRRILISNALSFSTARLLLTATNNSGVFDICETMRIGHEEP